MILAERLSLAVPVVLVLLASCAEPTHNGPASDAAIERIARPEAHFRSFLFRDAYGSKRVLSEVHRLGREAGCDAIGDSVESAVTKYLPRWRRELIASYREQVPPTELANAAQKVPRSAERALEPYNDRIWHAMGRRNGNLDTVANQEVIEAMSARAARDSRQGPPTERQLRELRYETVGFELCPELQAIIRMEDQ